MLRMLNEDASSAESRFVVRIRVVEADHRNGGADLLELEKGLAFVLQEQDVGDLAERHRQLDDFHLADGIRHVADVDDAGVRAAAGVFVTV